MNKIKVTDFIAQYLVESGLTHVFMLTGGGAMHLNDSLGKNTRLKKVYNHHEQASAMAAESFARITRKVPIVNVTTGPGGINTLNGVFGAWVDSIPMLVLSGQVKNETTVDSTSLPLRQLGDQECRIIQMVEGITKYSKMIKDPNEILYHLQKALYLTSHGRPGPVWLDIPMDVQGAYIDVENLRQFNDSELNGHELPQIKPGIFETIIQKIQDAKRPVILAGAGVHLSGMNEEFLALVEKLNIPVTSGWNAYDLIYDAHPCYAGRPGTIGNRAGNFTIQNADLVLILGSRLNIRQVSYNWASFARHAYKIMVDVDRAELDKPTLNIDMPIHANLKDFIPGLDAALNNVVLNDKSAWLSWCKDRVEKYPVVLNEYWENNHLVNPYCFMKKLSESLPEEQLIISGDGTACVASFQSMIIKPKQRLFTNSGCASMGYDLPAAIGAAEAAPGKEIVCLAGDGSIMQNLQELATIAFNHYPIKIFILNNNGYHSIRQTQQSFFGADLVGVGPDSGLGFPSFKKIAEGFDLPYVSCDKHATLDQVLEKTLKTKGPIICEVFIDLNQQFSPKLSSRRLENGAMQTSPLEDMAPFLSRNELEDNMLVKE